MCVCVCVVCVCVHACACMCVGVSAIHSFIFEAKQSRVVSKEWKSITAPTHVIYKFGEDLFRS